MFAKGESAERTQQRSNKDDPKRIAHAPDTHSTNHPPPPSSPNEDTPATRSEAAIRASSAESLSEKISVAIIGAPEETTKTPNALPGFSASSTFPTLSVKRSVEMSVKMEDEDPQGQEVCTIGGMASHYPG